MYSTPSRSSASRIMSAPVNLVSSLPLKMKKPPPFGRGLLRSTLWSGLVRARPRSSEANKAQESKEEYEGPRARCHCFVHVTERDPGSGCTRHTNLAASAGRNVVVPNGQDTRAEAVGHTHSPIG